MQENLEYYMNLPYNIVVKRDRDNEGNICYIARVLELPTVLVMGKQHRKPMSV